MALRTILESSRTTYFDISQETETESGEPPGELKITEVPELPETENGESHRNGGITTTRIRRAGNFYGKERKPLMN